VLLVLFRDREEVFVALDQNSAHRLGNFKDYNNAYSSGFIMFTLPSL
jgi:hypothetical protein